MIFYFELSEKKLSLFEDLLGGGEDSSQIPNLNRIY